MMIMQKFNNQQHILDFILKRFSNWAHMIKNNQLEIVDKLFTYIQIDELNKMTPSQWIIYVTYIRIVQRTMDETESHMSELETWFSLIFLRKCSNLKYKKKWKKKNEKNKIFFPSFF